jgi:hypothetical protein
MLAGGVTSSRRKGPPEPQSVLHLNGVGTAAVIPTWGMPRAGNFVLRLSLVVSLRILDFSPGGLTASPFLTRRR